MSEIMPDVPRQVKIRPLPRALSEFLGLLQDDRLCLDSNGNYAQVGLYMGDGIVVEIGHRCRSGDDVTVLSNEAGFTSRARHPSFGVPPLGTITERIPTTPCLRFCLFLPVHRGYHIKKRPCAANSPLEVEHEALPRPGERLTSPRSGVCRSLPTRNVTG